MSKFFDYSQAIFRAKHRLDKAEVYFLGHISDPLAKKRLNSAKENFKKILENPQGV